MEVANKRLSVAKTNSFGKMWSLAFKYLIMYEIAQEEFNKARLISGEINSHNNNINKKICLVQTEYRFTL